VYGHSGLKLKQLKAIESFVSRKDTYVTLPTGYNKSMIFAILPVLFDFQLQDKNSNASNAIAVAH